MNPILRNIIAVIIGLLIGSTINYALITLGHNIIPIEGIDPNNMEDLKRVMPTLESKFFIFPFLAHAFGTLTGALVTSRIVKKHKMKFALGIGVAFLIAGIFASIMIPAPTWFVVVDLIFTYIPMAWIGGKFTSKPA